ncbi:uncharacterized protein LOC129764601 [Toxorhynchites rutilus septentrionalis]|uniref:uncharacterized protein LOC129764601 n=1 Tax=Toxorhynchites rutilus septentrionalis TaxID=329112 RepID=UPI0024792C5A|nr:uncharacterized protein LOC129764601 [Toxorhynchites rutilus septentrionalis]
MSSVMEMSKMPTESSRSKMFLRSNSFQKLCSLAHPMRLKGFKSNKEALRSVFEALVVTTRGVIQTVTYRVLCVLFLTPFTRLVSRPLSLVSGEDGKINTVRLFLKLTLSAIITTDRAAKVIFNDGSSKDPLVDDETFEEPSKPADAAVQTETTVDKPDVPLEEFFACNDISSSSTQERGRRFHDSWPHSTTTAQEDAAKQSSVSFYLMVHGCVLFCFGQLSALVYLLTMAPRIPPGLIFLILAFGCIGYVMTRIFLFEVTAKKKTNPAKPSSRPLVKRKSTGIHLVLQAANKQLASLMRGSQFDTINNQGSPSMNQSGARWNRMLLCDDNKTISKMKIL